MAAAVRRSGAAEVAGWNWRYFGVVLCAFFALGVAAGFAVSDRELTLRFSRQINFDPRQVLLQMQRALIAFVRHSKLPGSLSPSELVHLESPGVLALVLHKDGFYALLADGSLRGPTSANAEGDLPILSGPGLNAERSEQLLDYATKLVRVEAELSAMVSEMRIAEDHSFSVFLQDSRTELVFDSDGWVSELERAAMLLRRWDGRTGAIARLDLTTPGIAVARLNPRIKPVSESVEPATVPALSALKKTIGGVRR